MNWLRTVYSLCVFFVFYGKVEDMMFLQEFHSFKTKGMLLKRKCGIGPLVLSPELELLLSHHIFFSRMVSRDIFFVYILLSMTKESISVRTRVSFADEDIFLQES
jgi:hypothetical protein